MAVKISSPWVEYSRYMEAMFGKDPEVKVVFDEDAVAIKLFVDNPVKADALSQILPETKNFGGVVLTISVIPGDEKQTKEQLFKAAFNGNPVVDDVVTVGGELLPNPFTYVVFKKEVVQFWNDNFGDPHGMKSTLYEEIARDAFNVDGVLYCTNVE